MIARRVGERLAERGLLPPDEVFHAGVARALTVGAARSHDVLPGWSAERIERAAASIGVSRGDIERVVGLGFEQAAALGQLVGTEDPEAARLGALFNLGICLFDVLFDRHPARAEALAGVLDPAALAAQIAEGRPFASAGDAAVDLVLAIVTAFFRGAAALPGYRAHAGSFARLIMQMHAGELASTHARRDAVPATRAVLRHLRAKSALPLRTVALLARLGRPSGVVDFDEARVRAMVGWAGDALWIVDDLVDAREDWLAGIWSRPWWLMAQGGRSLGPTVELAMARLWGSGILEAETVRLASRLRRLRAAAVPGGEALAETIGITVRSWVMQPRAP